MSAGRAMIATVVLCSLAVGAPVEAEAEARPLGSHFDGRFDDRLVDANGDGLFDHLRLSVGLSVPRSVPLYLMAYLSGGGTRLLGMAERTLGAGDHVVDVDASLGRLAKSGYRGTFTVDSLVLFENHSSHGMVRLDAQRNAHTTGPYSIAADTLQSPSWNGQVAAHGVDRDKDGQFESLVVEVGVSGLRMGGTYYCSAELARGPWSLTLGGEYLTLPRNSGTVRLEFPGACIAKTPSPDPLLIERFGLFYLENGRVSKLPHTSCQLNRIPIPGQLAAEAFEPSGPAKFRSESGGAYECW